MSAHLVTIPAAAVCAWIAWRLIRPILKWVALLGLLLVVLLSTATGKGISLGGPFSGPGSPGTPLPPTVGVQGPGWEP